MTPIYRKFWQWLTSGDAPRYIGHIAFGAVTAILLAACGRSDVGPWKEEVKLSDGRIIVVERFETFEVKSPIGGPGSAFIEEARIKIVWPVELATVPELVMTYRPVILDYDAVNNRWFAIGVDDDACGSEPFKAGHMDSTGRVNLHPNFEFRLIDNNWRSVEMELERLGRPANLLIRRSTVDQFEVVPLSEKARQDSDTALPKFYRQIQPYISC
ncbi:MAG: hypothetical protein OEW16_05950 [Gammaproteobacteria bacterium]|nr:hypothetical protein [Gammaproteobacteria bacterium]